MTLKRASILASNEMLPEFPSDKPFIHHYPMCATVASGDNESDYSR